MIYVLATCLVLLMLLAIFVQAVMSVDAYKLSTGTTWQRVLAGFNSSATIFLARTLGILSGVIAIGVDVLPMFDPASQIGGLIVGILDPKYVPYYSLFVSVLIEFARRRPGSLSPLPASSN